MSFANMKSQVLVFVAVFVLLAVELIGVFTPAALSAAPNSPAGAFSDVDIFTAQIEGGISMTGTFPIFFLPRICGSNIQGAVHLNNVTVVPIGLFEGTIGDPDSSLGSCPGNTISGSF